MPETPALKQRLGRPRGPAKDRLTFLLTTNTAGRLRLYARKRGVAHSDVAELAITSFLDAEGQEVEDYPRNKKLDEIAHRRRLAKTLEGS
jgi:hypothetical protein